MTRPRLGFAGVGRIGARRLHAIHATGAADVAAVFDVSEDNVQQVLQGSQIPTDVRVESYNDLLAADLDGVIISTPNRLHAEQTTQALEEEMAVFCQKPLGCDAAEVEQVIDTAQRVDRLLGVDLTYRRGPAIQEVYRRARAGEIGDIYAADLAFHNAYGPDKPWFYDRRLSGGGCFLDLGVHMVDLALWTMGFPKVTNVSSRFFAKGRPVQRHDREMVEDYAVARLDLDTGATAQIACSWHLSAGQNAQIHATFHGTEGSLHVYNVNGHYFDLVAEKRVGTSKETLVMPNGKWDSSNAIAFAEDLATSNRFRPESARHAELARVLDQVYGS